MWWKKKNIDTGTDALKEPNEPFIPPAMTLNPWGFVAVAAIKAGMLPQIVAGKDVGYDARMFEKFWNLLCEDLDIRVKPEIADRDGMIARKEQEERRKWSEKSGGDN